MGGIVDEDALNLETAKEFTIAVRLEYRAETEVVEAEGGQLDAEEEAEVEALIEQKGDIDVKDE